MPLLLKSPGAGVLVTLSRISAVLNPQDAAHHIERGSRPGVFAEPLPSGDWLGPAEVQTDPCRNWPMVVLPVSVGVEFC